MFPPRSPRVLESTHCLLLCAFSACLLVLASSCDQDATELSNAPTGIKEQGLNGLATSAIGYQIGEKQFSEEERDVRIASLEAMDESDNGYLADVSAEDIAWDLELYANRDGIKNFVLPASVNGFDGENFEIILHRNAEVEFVIGEASSIEELSQLPVALSMVEMRGAVQQALATKLETFEGSSLFGKFTIVNTYLRLTDEGVGSIVAKLGIAIGLKDVAAPKENEKSPPISYPIDFELADRYIIESVIETSTCAIYDGALPVWELFGGCRTNNEAFLLSLAKSRANGSESVNGTRVPSECNQIPQDVMYPSFNNPNGGINTYIRTYADAPNPSWNFTDCYGESYFYSVDNNFPSCAADPQTDAGWCASPNGVNYVINHVDDGVLATRPTPTALFWCVDKYELTNPQNNFDFQGGFLEIAWVL